MRAKRRVDMVSCPFKNVDRKVDVGPGQQVQVPTARTRMI
ncbi:hypothetical protein STXM2123_3440 [Streptomyces sp. F-3]|nr:hypothetical protein STXM2123_3440 [Streptomyces sp. F-3]